MTNRVTSELVERIAKARVDGIAAHYNAMPAADRANVPEFALKPWDEQEPIEQHHIREVVLRQLNEITPHLLAEGWLAPATANQVREAVTDQTVQDLQTSLMDHLKLDPIGSGYTTRESINGYSEGAEHGTISLASRIKHILDGGEQS